MIQLWIEAPLILYSLKMPLYFFAEDRAKIVCPNISINHFSEPQVVNSSTKSIPIHSGVSPQGVSKQGNKARKSHTAISFTANTLFLSRRVADIMMGKLSPTHNKPCVWWWVEFWLELKPISRKKIGYSMMYTWELSILNFIARTA